MTPEVEVALRSRYLRDAEFHAAVHTYYAIKARGVPGPTLDDARAVADMEAAGLGWALRNPSSEERVVNPNPARRLVCPYCGGNIEAEMSYTTVSFSEHRDLTGYECESYGCDARWTNRGDVERLPKHLRNPSSEGSV